MRKTNCASPHSVSFTNALAATAGPLILIDYSVLVPNESCFVKIPVTGFT